MEHKTLMALIAPALAIISRANFRIGIMMLAGTTTIFSFHASANQGSPPGTVTCADPFGRESTRLDLVRAFGVANVEDQEIKVQEGAVRRGTVIYPSDPRSRLEIFGVSEVRRHLSMIRISGESQWTGWRKVHIGMTLEEVEALNGKPFKFRDFNTVARGMVTAWQGGAMERIPGGCRLTVRFKPDDDARSDALTELVGELVSSDPKVRSLGLTVNEIYTYYQRFQR